MPRRRASSMAPPRLSVRTTPASKGSPEPTALTARTRGATPRKSISSVEATAPSRPRGTATLWMPRAGTWMAGREGLRWGCEPVGGADRGALAKDIGVDAGVERRRYAAGEDEPVAGPEAFAEAGAGLVHGAGIERSARGAEGG